MQKDIALWSENCAGPDTHEAIRKTSQLLSIFVCLNTILCLVTSILHAIPREHDDQWMILLKILDDYRPFPGADYAEALVRLATVFWVYPMLLPTHQILYGGLKLKFQFQLLSKFVRELGTHLEGDLESCHNKKFQEMVSRKLHFCVRRHIDLQTFVINNAAELRWFVIAFIVAGLSTGTGCWIQLYTTLTTKNYDRGFCIVVLFSTSFWSLFAVGQFLQDEIFTFSSDGWADRGDVTHLYEEEAWGSLSIRIHSPHVKDFDEYYWSLRPENNTRNPWFREFWEWRFNCTLSEGGRQQQQQLPTETLKLNSSSQLHDDAAALSASWQHFTLQQWQQSSTVNRTRETHERPCTGEESLVDKHRQDAKLSFVIKAIYSLAHALHDMQQDLCGDGGGNPLQTKMCDKLLPFNGSLFKNYLMNVSFEYEEETIEFDDKGDPPGRYDILNFQKMKDGTYDYVEVGSWNNRSLMWNQSVKRQFGRNRTGVKSVCAEDCPKGHYKNVQQGGKDKRCCWVCVPCPSGEILVDDGESCTRCRQGFVPDDLKIVCLELPIEFMHWNDPEAIVAMIFASFGFLSTWFAFIVFMKHNNTPIVKSSTRELCYIILAGMTLSHGSIFAILAKPSVTSCALSRTLPGLSFSMIYAALLTKTNRIARILAGSKERFPTRKPLFMSAAAQVVITCFLVTVEIVISWSMLHLQHPDVTNIYHSKKTLLTCNTTPEAIVVPLAFDFFLIILCTLYAVKTRNVPENFNEAKFIGFAMYTTCVIWIAFVPIYFGSDSKVITLCMCVTLSAMVTWVFLFVPKLYIIILKPERNNRSFFTTSKSIRCHIGARVASAISEKSSTNSWRESTASAKELNVNSTKCFEKDPGPPQKRTCSCQTETEFLQVLLNPRTLLDAYAVPRNSCILPKIIEKDCCEADSCHMKNIIIKLPDNSRL